MTFVDPYEGRRRTNPQTGRIEVNMGGGAPNCLVPPCPQWDDNWQPEPKKPWETMEIKPGWEPGQPVPLPLPSNEKSSKWGDAVQLAEEYIARRNTANPAASFIKDPTGSGKLIKFNHPLDLRSVEEKMGGYPFNQI